MVKDGYRFVLPLVLGACISFLFWKTTEWRWLSGLSAGVFFLLLWFCVNFFRDPVRVIPTEPDLLVCPADGKVMEVRRIDDPFVGPAWEVLIFLNIFNVHSQRSPFTAEAKVGKITYHPGKFLAAYAPKASLENEQNWIEMEGPAGRRVVVKQIAGLIARRVLCWVTQGQTVPAGEKIGFIRFGSQVDLIFPASAEVLVKPGQAVAGGETPLARFPR